MPFRAPSNPNTWVKQQVGEKDSFVSWVGRVHAPGPWGPCQHFQEPSPLADTAGQLLRRPALFKDFYT